MTHEDLDYIEALRARGYRVTPQRLLVLDAVCELNRHATIADIQAQVNAYDPTIDRSTIYRSLDILVEVGLLTESELGKEGKIYAVVGQKRHHHLVCLSCGKVMELAPDALNPLIEAIQSQYKFTLQADHLVFNGLCEACSGDQATP